MIKQSIRTTFCALLLFTSVAHTNAQTTAKPFELTGTIDGLQEGTLYLNYLATDKRVVDSAAIVNGKFFFKGTINTAYLAWLQLKEVVSDNHHFTYIFIAPGKMVAKLPAADFKQIELTGSDAHHLYRQLQLAKNAVDTKYKKQIDSLLAEKDHDKKGAIRERLAPYFAEMDQQDYIFIRQHPKTPVSAWLLASHVRDMTLDSLEYYYNRLGAAVQQSAAGTVLTTAMNKLRVGSPGSMAASFSSVDIDGKPLSLADYKGRYVLLDFWASWCVPCRKGNPHLINMYAKYKDKGLEIIGVSDDDAHQDAWKEAVAKDKIHIWKHVLRGAKTKANGGTDNSNDISNLYDVHILPTKILIDPKGMIVGRYGTEPEELDKKLLEIFGK